MSGFSTAAKVQAKQAAQRAWIKYGTWQDAADAAANTLVHYLSEGQPATDAGDVGYDIARTVVPLSEQP